jgi:hypothetical protein
MPRKLGPIHVFCRRLAMIAFWGLVAYVATAAFGSIFMELYGPPPKRLAHSAQLEHMSHRERTWCIGRLVGLKNQLDRRVAEALKAHEVATQGGSRWSTRHPKWVAELSDATQRCGLAGDAEIAAAYEQLGVLANGYDNAIVTLDATRGEGLERLRGTLKELEHLQAH